MYSIVFFISSHCLSFDFLCMRDFFLVYEFFTIQNAIKEMSDKKNIDKKSRREWSREQRKGEKTQLHTQTQKRRHISISHKQRNKQQRKCEGRLGKSRRIRNRSRNSGNNKKRTDDIPLFFVRYKNFKPLSKTLSRKIKTSTLFGHIPHTHIYGTYTKHSFIHPLSFVFISSHAALQHSYSYTLFRFVLCEFDLL